MKTYEHTQSGKLIVVMMLAMAAVMAVLGVCLAWQLLISVPIVLVTAWVFHSLTIELTSDELHWYFGPGLISKRVRLTEIASARAVQTTVLEGWGIHLSRFGWLYNVAGRDAVAIGLRNGKKFALGSDEPGGIVRNNPANSSLNELFKA